MHKYMVVIANFWTEMWVESVISFFTENVLFYCEFEIVAIFAKNFSPKIGVT